MARATKRTKKKKKTAGGKPKRRTAPSAKKPAARRTAAKAPARTRVRTATAAAPRARAGMEAHVATELRKRGLDDVPEVVATIAAVGRGYRKGPAADPGFPTLSLDIDRLVAEGLVDRFAKGVPPAGIDREPRRRTVRSAVNIVLRQQPEVAGANETARRTLTSLALGTWRPGSDENALRNAIPGFVVACYRAGLRRVSPAPGTHGTPSTS